MNEWIKDENTKVEAYNKGNKHLWNTGNFSTNPYPETSIWNERWTVADLINNRVCNHRYYNSLEEAMEKE